MCSWWSLQEGCTSSTTPIPVMSRRSATYLSTIQSHEESNWARRPACVVGGCRSRAESDQVPLHGNCWPFQRISRQLSSSTDREWGLERSVVCGVGSGPGLLPIPKRSVVPVCYAGSGGRETGLVVPVCRRRYEPAVV